MTLFNTQSDKAPPKRNDYSVGFIHVYKAFNKFTCKHEAFKEFQKQKLEKYADHIAWKATDYHMYCRIKDRFQMDLRRWLHNKGWDDELFNESLKFLSPKEAFDAFKEDKWTHCDGIDCSKLKVKWNPEFLRLGDMRIIGSDHISQCLFKLRFEG